MSLSIWPIIECSSHSTHICIPGHPSIRSGISEVSYSAMPALTNKRKSMQPAKSKSRPPSSSLHHCRTVGVVNSKSVDFILITGLVKVGVAVAIQILKQGLVR